jgi:hypothetical protein
MTDKDVQREWELMPRGCVQLLKAELGICYSNSMEFYKEPERFVHILPTVRKYQRPDFEEQVNRCREILAKVGVRSVALIISRYELPYCTDPHKFISLLRYKPLFTLKFIETMEVVISRLG